VEVTAQQEMTVVLQARLAALEKIEAAYIQQWHLAEPSTSVKAFADKHGIGPTEFAEIRGRALPRLKKTH
jgi:hypothetical protein